MISKPLISIIIPTCNRAHFIEETLNSIIAQTYPYWECLVIDDKSVDNTIEIVSNISKKDKRIKFYERPESLMKGVSSCRNYGIKKSTGEFIAFCDDDDFWTVDKLKLQIDYFEANPNANVVTGNLEYVDAKGNKTGRTDFHTNTSGRDFKDFLFKNRTSMITPLIRRSVVDKVGLFNTEFIIQEDYQFWIRVSYYYKFYTVNRILAYVRKHDLNSSISVQKSPLDKYLRYKKIVISLKKWGKYRFSKDDLRLIKHVKVKKNKDILKNDCKGYYQKFVFIKMLFKNSFSDGLYFVFSVLR